MNSNSVRAILQDLGKRARVKKKLNPHAFRHARATELAKHLKESQLRAYMGWTPGSPMPGIYVHLSGRDTDAAILAAYGVSTPDSSTMLSRPKACPACSASNPNGSRMCLRCGQPLDMETANRVKGSEKQWLLGNAEAMLALRCLGLSEDGRWDDYFEALRRGELALPTPGRAARRGAEVLPLTRNLRKTG